MLSSEMTDSTVHGRGGKRERLVASAGDLLHRQGVATTTLAQVADAAEVPAGNVYYYFKTKDAIGEELIARYGDAQLALRQEWESCPDPRSRLEAFVDMTVGNREVLARHGCPIGTLNAELHKYRGPLAREAAALFAESLTWLEEQFRALGREQESPDLAVHLLSALQGVSLLAHSFGDPNYVVREAQRLKNWIRAL